MPPILKRLVCTLACFLVAGCAMDGHRVDDRNFAVDTFRPSPDELRLAEVRARNYRSCNPALLRSAPPYLAVTAGVILPSEIPQNLYAKLIGAETTGSVLAHGGEDLAYQDFVLHGIVIFDARTGRLVSNQGYVAADTPHLGEVARFGNYFARFIGTGH